MRRYKKTIAAPRLNGKKSDSCKSAGWSCEKGLNETDRQIRAQQLILDAKKVNADISNKQVESANKLIESRMKMMQGNQNGM